MKREVHTGYARRSACLLAILLGANPHTAGARLSPSDTETAAPSFIDRVDDPIEHRGDVRSLKGDIFGDASKASEIKSLDLLGVSEELVATEQGDGSTRHLSALNSHVHHVDGWYVVTRCFLSFRSFSTVVPLAEPRSGKTTFRGDAH